MAVRGCTFHLQTMTSKDWAHQVNNFFAGVSAVTKGCEATLTADKKIAIAEGYFYIYGRLCAEDGTSLIPVPTVTTATHRMLVYEIDMSKTNTKSSFNQGQYKILSAYPGYPSPTMENLDEGGTIFQLQFCTWDQSVSGITNFSFTAPKGRMAQYVQLRSLTNNWLEEGNNYFEGNIVLHKSKLYRNIKALFVPNMYPATYEPDAEHWVETTIMDEYLTLVNGMKVKKEDIWRCQEIGGARRCWANKPFTISSVYSQSSAEYNAVVEANLPPSMRPLDPTTIIVTATAKASGLFKATFVTYNPSTGNLAFNLSANAAFSNYPLVLGIQLLCDV